MLQGVTSGVWSTTLSQAIASKGEGHPGSPVRRRPVDSEGHASIQGQAHTTNYALFTCPGATACGQRSTGDGPASEQDILQIASGASPLCACCAVPLTSRDLASRPSPSPRSTTLSPRCALSSQVTGLLSSAIATRLFSFFSTTTSTHPPPLTISSNLRPSRAPRQSPWT